MRIPKRSFADRVIRGEEHCPKCGSDLTPESCTVDHILPKVLLYEKYPTAALRQQWRDQPGRKNTRDMCGRCNWLLGNVACVLAGGQGKLRGGRSYPFSIDTRIEMYFAVEEALGEAGVFTTNKPHPSVLNRMIHRCIEMQVAKMGLMG
jgi:hypothetical protein